MHGLYHHLRGDLRGDPEPTALVCPTPLLHGKTAPPMASAPLTKQLHATPRRCHTFAPTLARAAGRAYPVRLHGCSQGRATRRCPGARGLLPRSLFLPSPLGAHAQR
eukprot:5023829-Pleurochrysis_carterae.AAC.1